MESVSFNNLECIANNATNLADCYNSTMQIKEKLSVTSAGIIAEMNKHQLEILAPSLGLVIMMFILGVPGNLIAVLVYLLKMKRSTAGYFIITLAISDLINSVFSLPIEIFLIVNFWSFDIAWLCKLSRFLTAAMNNTSSFILVAIAFERFRSICLPLRPRISKKCAQWTCIIVSSTAVCSAIPMVFGYGTFTYKVTFGNTVALAKTCLIDDSVLNTSYPTVLLIYFFIGHILVFLILTILYIFIARKLFNNASFYTDKKCLNPGISKVRSSSSGSSLSNVNDKATTTISTRREIELSKSKQTLLRSISSQSNLELQTTRKHGGQAYRTKRLTCMLFLVTSVFEISFIPYLVIVSIRSQHPDYYTSLSTPGKMTYQLLLRSYFINCAANPVIYCFYNQNFRHGVKRLFRLV